jgi:hypothetical protein
MDAGVGAFSLNADTTMSLDCGTNFLLDGSGATSQIDFQLGTDTNATNVSILNNTGTALFEVYGDETITIGGAAGTGAIGLGTGAAAKAITIGNAASASLTMEAGVGAASLTADTTVDITAGTNVNAVVSSGTVRTVGGLAYSSTQASSAISNTTTETYFDQSYTAPANTVKAGTVIKIRTQGIATSTNGTDTLIIKGYIGPDCVWTSATVDVADNDVWFADIALTCRTAGATGTFVGNCFTQDPDAAGTAPVWANLASTVFDTTGTLAIRFSATWGAVHTGNSCRQDYLTVEIV